MEKEVIDMNCKKIREFIMTDYVDGEAGPELEREIRKHLAGCGGCREFESALQKKVIEPFKNAGKLEAPGIVWDNVREAIAAPEEEPVFIIRRPAFSLALAAVAVILIAIFTMPFFTGPGPVASYIEEQAGFFAYLDNGASGFTNGEDEGLGTAIEEYFL